MTFRLLSVLVFIGLISSCSLRNDFETTKVALRVESDAVSTPLFEQVSSYDKACLTVEGNGTLQTAWYDISKTADSMSVEIKIPNLLGGFNYTFTLIAVNLQAPSLNQKITELRCPRAVPKTEGWARLGKAERFISTKSGGEEIEMSLAFEQQVPSPVITISTQPTPVTAINGAATLSVTASLENAIPGTNLSYQWQKQDGGAEPFQNVGTDNQVLSLTGLTSANDNDDKYRVRVSASGATSVISNEVVLIVNPNSAVECSGDCYSDAAAISNGVAIGPDSTEMVYVFANGTSGFKVWREKNGDRILNASGKIENGWQKKLDAAGTEFSTDFVTASDVAGRACPENVVLDPTNMFAEDQCLYYDPGNAPQALNKDQRGTVGNDYLEGWGPTASYFEGNIKTCANKGMRLPALYETNLSSAPANLPIEDKFGSEPDWAGEKGVPPFMGDTWTASASPENVQKYFTWKLGSPSPEASKFSFNEVKYVRCVVPNSSPITNSLTR
ncbi:MAG: hypothetical protein ACKN9V_08190 [Pseudomonadota bacterium]